MTFISLLSPQGRGREAIEYLRNLKPPNGITVQSIYVTLGRYDAVLVFDADDIDKALKFAIAVGTATDYTIETLAAIPANNLKAWLVK